MREKPYPLTGSTFAAAARRGAGAACRVVAASFLVVAAHGLSPRAALAARQQPEKPKIADEVEKKEAEREPAKPAEGGKGQGGKNRTPKNAPRPAQQIEVTFKTDLPESEIFLNRGGSNMQSLGKTDAGGKLTVRLPRGRHQITASRIGARIQRQQIEVAPDSTDFSFNLAPPAPPAKPREEVASTALPPEPAKEEPKPADPDEIVRRFLDAKESEGVTAADLQQLREQARAALEREPENRQHEAQALFAEGQLAYVRADYASALVSLNRAVLANPDYVPAHYALGNAYLATNQPAEAFKSYQRASHLDKNLTLAVKGMGDALSKQGKTREAAQYYNRAKVSGQPLPTDTGLTSARELKKRKKWAAAVKEFEEIARAEPSVDVFIDIGDCYVALEQPLSASKAYQRAAEIDPKAALAFYKYGEVMFKMREYAAAMEALERALALDTTGAQFNRQKARERANEAAKKLGVNKSN